MHKYLITTYKVIGFIINPLIILAMLFWLVVILFDNASQTLTLIDYIIGVILSWASITWIYYILKTKGIKNLTNLKVISKKTIEDKYLARFRLDYLIGITNISFASILAIYSIYILFTDPIRSELKGDELFRMITIIISLIYSILQIQYSILIFKVQRND